ncbi:Cytochrome c oxidase accessory protein CcoG [Pseudomonas marincola]|uniref:Cytochrome c oxidase accessory protein CcoG n=1 Tax=Pseudomonas marincola TaxID=437900 RepID=A0A653E5C5_9PSED|nr:cytochrome c oxidase accessory protein CcoG [Pseudomonas marincola]CAE6901782.1 Cytochrome c oxidase accessory protein CcoG [Pseudomonas marincola]
MSERIPATLIEPTTSSSPVRQTPAMAGGAIHTRSFTGLYRSLRLYGAGALFVLYFGTAWLNWNGRQAVLWDLGKSQFHIFGATFWPQDFVLFSAILIIAAFGLFFITVFAGRVWCGYTCPQSVWTWVFMRIEHFTEGERHQRIKLDNAPWSINKLLRRTSKHGLWLGVSLLTALAFVGYFMPVRALSHDLISFNLSTSESVWLFLFTAATYMNAGWLREKVCRDMCPYSRFQSVMFDSDTLLVTYDARRGENRGARKKEINAKAAGLGDCIDCTVCVQVCPTGIDIRDGLQLDCISCGACIDACDSVMDKMGYARGLIRYTSERALAGGQTRFLRPRLVAYAATLLVMFGAFAWGLEQRDLIALDVHKDRGLFRENSQGQIENIYVLKVINKTQQARDYAIALVDSPDFALNGQQQVSLEPGEILDVPVSVVMLADKPERSSVPIYFAVSDSDDIASHVRAKSAFVAPLNR